MASLDQRITAASSSSNSIGSISRKRGEKEICTLEEFQLSVAEFLVFGNGCHVRIGLEPTGHRFGALERQSCGGWGQAPSFLGHGLAQ